MNQSIISHTLVALLFLVLGFGIGFAVFNSPTSVSVGEEANSVAQSGSIESERSNSDTTASNAEGDVQVSTGSLTQEQAALARSLGIDPNEVTITASMVACAEAELGTARISELQNGATPSFSEGLTLATCYTKG